MSRVFHPRGLILVLALVLLLLLSQFALVQADDEGTLEIVGVLTSLDETTAVVSGVSFDLTTAEVGDSVAVGQTVTIHASLSETLVWVAVTIELAEQPEASPEASPEPSPEASPEASPEPDDEDLTIKIVIEGPVEEININVITIWGIDIEVEPDDSILTIIQIGDELRVEGDILEGEGDTIIIVAINIIIVDVDVFVLDDGQVWRDIGNCSNPPPAHAPAHGWRRRCQPQGGGGAGGGSS